MALYQAFLHVCFGFLAIAHGHEIVPPPFYRAYALVAMKQDMDSVLLSEQISAVEDTLHPPSSVDPILSSYHVNWWSTPQSLQRPSEKALERAWMTDRKIFPRRLYFPKVLLASTSANIELMTNIELREARAASRNLRAQLEKEKKTVLEGMRRIWLELERLDVQIKAACHPDLRPPVLDLNAPPSAWFNSSDAML